jgi:hypothetical protein
LTGRLKQTGHDTPNTPPLVRLHGLQ